MSLLAKMGYVGFVQFESVSGTSGASTIAVRVTSCDVKTSQEITYPEVIDGKIDTTLYQLGPKITGGSVAFPLVHEGTALANYLPTSKSGSTCQTNADSMASTLWGYAAQRDGQGRMLNVFNCNVRYADNLAYTYPGCLVNTMTWTINQSDAVNISAEIIGGATVPTYPPGTARAILDNFPGPGSTSNINFLSPARIVTWNDAQIAIYGIGGVQMLSGQEIREFTCTINNGIERYFTLNGMLAPQDIAAKKREISGTLKVMGSNLNLSAYTDANDQRFTSEAGIGFGYSLGASVNPYWATGLWGVTYTIEEVALSTGLFETSTTWRALGDCTNNFLATQLGQGQNIVYPVAGQYGASTAPDYPAFDVSATPITNQNNNSGYNSGGYNQ